MRWISTAKTPRMAKVIETPRGVVYDGKMIPRNDLPEVIRAALVVLNEQQHVITGAGRFVSVRGGK